MRSLYNLWFLIRGLSFAYLQRFLATILFIPLPPKMSACTIITRDGKYLVVDINYRPGLALPGGLMDPYETLEETVAREVFEETGLTVTKATYLTSAKDVQYGISVVVAGFVVETTGTITDSHEGAVRWVTAQEYLENASYKNSKAVFEYYLAHYESHWD